MGDEQKGNPAFEGYQIALIDSSWPDFLHDQNNVLCSISETPLRSLSHVSSAGYGEQMSTQI